MRMGRLIAGTERDEVGYTARELFLARGETTRVERGIT
jgi:hypothetical protein